MGRRIIIPVLVKVIIDKSNVPRKAIIVNLSDYDVFPEDINNLFIDCNSFLRWNELEFNTAIRPRLPRQIRCMNADDFMTFADAFTVPVKYFTRPLKRY